MPLRKMQEITTGFFNFLKLPAKIFNEKRSKIYRTYKMLIERGTKNAPKRDFFLDFAFCGK